MLLLDLFLVGGGALAGGWVCRRFGVPEVLGYLGAGVALGHLIHGRGEVDSATIAAIAQFAVVFRMFTLGLDFDARRLKGRWRPALTSGLLEMGLCTLAGVLVARVLDWPMLHGAILGAALGTTSTSILSRAIADRNMTTREDARAAGAATLVEDLIAMGLLAFLVVMVDPASPNAMRPWDDALQNAFGLLVFAALAFTAGAIFVPAGLDRLGRAQSDELQTLAVLGILFGFTALSEVLLHAGRPVGAFLAGIAVGAARHAPGVSARILPLRDVLAALAYVSIGLILDPATILAVAPLAAALALGFVALKVFAIALGLRLGGVNAVTSARAGAILGQAGTMGLIVACRPFIGDEAAARLIAFAFVAWALTVGLTPLRLRYGPDALEALVRLLGARERGTRATRLRRSPDADTRHDAYVACLAAGCAIALAALSALVATGAEASLPDAARVPVEAAAGLGAGLLLLPFAFVVAMASRRALHRRVHQAVLAPARLSRGARDGARAWSHAGTVTGLVLAFATSLAMGNVLAPPAARLPLLLGALAACAFLGVRRALLARLIDQCEALVQDRPQVDARLNDFRGVSPFGFDVDAFLVPAGSRGAWSTLAALDLRKATGASVVALVRPGSPDPLPLGAATRVHPGDELVVGGTAAQLVAATRYVLAPMERAPPAARPGAAGATQA